MEKSEVSGIAVLWIGIALLVTTFFNVYLFIKENISILPVLSSIGLVHWIGSGKTSEKSLAAGFKRSALLVLIAITASKVTPMIM